MDIIIIPNIPDLPQGVIKKYFAVWQEDPAVNNTEVFKAISQTLYVIDLVYAEKEEEKCHEMAKFLLSLSMKFPHIISRKYKRKLEEIIYSPQKKKKTNCSRKKKILGNQKKHYLRYYNIIVLKNLPVYETLKNDLDEKSYRAL